MTDTTHAGPHDHASEVASAGDRRITSIAIVGGGTAGWMAASVLSRALTSTGCRITVVESPDIKTVGVGEATIPPIRDLLRFLDINEADFVEHTQATYKLGIRFRDWRRRGHTFWHPFGSFGVPINRRPFHHAWHKARAMGLAPRVQDFSLCAALGEEHRFRYPDTRASDPVAGLRYALHFHAGLVADYLSAYARRLGVSHVRRTLQGATRCPDGRLDELVMTDGSRIRADFYVDCSGFRGALIEQAMGTGYLSWTDYLPCDRAVALPTALSGARPPYTDATALTFGWRWRIPLQGRVGNGYVFCSSFTSEEHALTELLAALSQEPAAEPNQLRFVTGRRRLFWNQNCVALGLASGFLEPLESTSIHLVMSGLYSLLEHFPDRAFAQANIDAYNAELGYELERIRDFIILHYCLTERADTPFWNHCRSMPIPDTLSERIELFRACGRIRPKAGELFTDASWFYIFDGMGIVPHSHDPLLEVVGDDQLRCMLARMTDEVRAAVAASPTHDSYFPGRPLTQTATANRGPPGVT